MLDTNHRRIGHGRALPIPGDIVTVATLAGDYTGVVTELLATLGSQQWTVVADAALGSNKDGPTIIVSDRSAITLLTERMLPIVQRGEVWRLDVKTIEMRRERGAL